MKIEVIRDKKGMQQIKNLWIDLLENSGSSTVFLTWEWINLWWDIFQEGRMLRVLTFWDDNELIGIAPLLSRQVRYLKLFSFRRVEFLASGEDEKDEICSEYLNLIIKKGKEEYVIECFVDYFKKNNEWDEMILRRLAVENINTDILIKKFRSSGFRSKTGRKENAPYISLPEQWDELLNGLNAKFRYKVKRARKRLCEKAEVKIIKIENEEDLDWAFNALVDLHTKRWNYKGMKGCFGSEKFKIFHRKVIKILLANKQLMLIFLLINGKPVAVFYNYYYAGKVLFYQSGLDLNYHPELGVGNVLRGHSIQIAIEQGAREYDFLRGEKQRHCKDWATGSRQIIQLRISKSSFKETLYCAALHIGRKIKKSGKLFWVNPGFARRF